MKKLVVTLAAALCAALCLLFAACGKELNYLKADRGDGKLKTEFDFGEYSSGQIEKLKSDIAELTFYYEYYPDNSTEKADMSKIKSKYFTGGGSESAGIPEALEQSCSYTLYFYYEGHEPTADFSDALAVRISFWVTE